MSDENFKDDGVDFVNAISEIIDESLNSIKIEQTEPDDQDELDSALRIYLTRGPEQHRVDINVDYHQGAMSEAFKEKIGELPNIFGTTSQPDFIIIRPQYRVVIEYKKYKDSDEMASAEKMRTLIGQCLGHYYAGKFHYILGFFRDASNEGKVYNSMPEKQAEELNAMLAEKKIFLKVKDDSIKNKNRVNRK